MIHRPHLVVAALAAALAGCAGLNTVTADVSSYGTWPAARKPGPFAFERLPSQEAHAQQQDKLEAAARAALAKAGFTPAGGPQDAEVTVQVSTRLTRVERSLSDDPFLWHGGFWHGVGWRGSGIGLSTTLGSPRYEREVGLLLRDRRTGQPLYEAHARNDNSGSDDPAVLTALFEAALKDFPTPAINPRRVSIPLPQKR